jgi:hypothetical protein
MSPKVVIVDFDPRQEVYAAVHVHVHSVSWSIRVIYSRCVSQREHPMHSVIPRVERIEKYEAHRAVAVRYRLTYPCSAPSKGPGTTNMSSSERSIVV